MLHFSSLDTVESMKLTGSDWLMVNLNVSGYYRVNYDHLTRVADVQYSSLDKNEARLFQIPSVRAKYDASSSRSEMQAPHGGCGNDFLILGVIDCPPDPFD